MEDSKRRFIRIGGVIEKTGKSRSSIYRDIGRGKFPASVKIGDAASAWIESEVDLWMDERVAESRAASA